MQKIKLTQGKYALVDDEDFEWLSQYSWHAYPDKHTFYALRGLWHNGIRSTTPMHRDILKLKIGDKLQVDHIDRNGLNNCKSNLRIGTHGENMRNRRKQAGSSIYKGAQWYPLTSKWRVQIQVNHNKQHVGYFDNETDAAKAYDEKAKELFGKYANLNFKELI